jgi:hypothetical protein
MYFINRACAIFCSEDNLIVDLAKGTHSICFVVGTALFNPFRVVKCDVAFSGYSNLSPSGLCIIFLLDVGEV